MQTKERSVVYNSCAEGLKPDPILSVSQWAEKNINLPGDTPESGPYKLYRTPYAREILDSLGPTSDADTVTFLKGTQVGATTVGLIFIAYCIAHQPGNFLMVQASMDAVKTVSKGKLQPLIESTPILKKLVVKKHPGEDGNSLTEKRFPGGSLRIVTAGSTSALRGTTNKYLFLDELSEYEADVSEQGDPASIAKQRTVAFRSKGRKIFQASTPTIRGVDKTEREFERSDKRYYHVPCPFCGFRDKITWERIKWDKDQSGNHLPHTVYLECLSCGSRITEDRKDWFMSEENGACWIAENLSGDPNHYGYHLSTLYAPYLMGDSWEDLVREWLYANELAKAGDITALKTFTNLVLGETWQEKGTEVNKNALINRKEYYNAEVPSGALFLTAGVDVQSNRIEASVYGWNDKEECWAINHYVWWGDPSDLESNCWSELTNLIYNKEYMHESGNPIKIGAVGIDMGHLANQVKEYARSKLASNVYIFKGDNGKPDNPYVSSPHKTTTGREKKPVVFFYVGTFSLKVALINKLNKQDPGSGYIHFPNNETYGEEFFAQLTAEVIRTKFKNGRPTHEFYNRRSGKRNEALDCAVYSYAALKMRRPDFVALEKRFGDIQSSTEQKIEQPQPTREQQVVAQRRQRYVRNTNPFSEYDRKVW